MVSGPLGALSLALLETNSLGSSGGGALVGAKDGVADALGRSAVAGSEEDGRPVASSLPFADTTAMATAVPTPSVASTPPPISSSRRRLLRDSDASASAAQSGVGSVAPLVHG